MIPNSFRRIALAQGLLPTRSQLVEVERREAPRVADPHAGVSFQPGEHLADARNSGLTHQTQA